MDGLIYSIIYHPCEIIVLRFHLIIICTFLVYLYISLLKQSSMDYETSWQFPATLF